MWLAEDDVRPNGAAILLLTDGMTSALMDEYDRCLDLFDGRDPAAVQAARERWRACRDKGWELHYWQQTERGGWTEKASANKGTSDGAG